MKRFAIAGLATCAVWAGGAIVYGAAMAQATNLLLLRDQPQDIGGVTALCTGVGADMQSDRDLQDYTLRIRFAGGGGQYLTNARVQVTTLAGQPVIAVQCPGAWLFFKMSPGKYRLTAVVQCHRRKSTVFALQSGAQIILRFPEITGNQ